MGLHPHITRFQTVYVLRSSRTVLNVWYWRAAWDFALYPVNRISYLHYMVSALATANFISVIVFGLLFHKYNKVDAKLNKHDANNCVGV